MFDINDTKNIEQPKIFKQLKLTKEVNNFIMIDSKNPNPFNVTNSTDLVLRILEEYYDKPENKVRIQRAMGILS